MNDNAAWINDLLRHGGVVLYELEYIMVISLLTITWSITSGINQPWNHGLVDRPDCPWGSLMQMFQGHVGIQHVDVSWLVDHWWNLFKMLGMFCMTGWFDRFFRISPNKFNTDVQRSYPWDVAQNGEWNGKASARGMVIHGFIHLLNRCGSYISWPTGHRFAAR